MVVLVILKVLRVPLDQILELVADLATEDPAMPGAHLSSVRPTDPADAATTPVTSATVAAMAAASLVLGRTWAQGSASASAAKAATERASEKAAAAATTQATVREITERLSGEMIDVRTDYLTFI